MPNPHRAPQSVQKMIPAHSSISELKEQIDSLCYSLIAVQSMLGIIAEAGYREQQKEAAQVGLEHIEILQQKIEAIEETKGLLQSFSIPINIKKKDSRHE